MVAFSTEFDLQGNCYISQNIETVTSDEFIDLIVEKGCRYFLYFHYMPVGNDAAV